MSKIRVRKLKKAVALLADNAEFLGNLDYGQLEKVNIEDIGKDSITGYPEFILKPSNPPSRTNSEVDK